MSKRKPDIKILFQNHNFDSSTRKVSRRQPTIASQPSNQKSNSQIIQNSKVKFEYSFNDYLKLTLAKVLPYPNIILIPEEKIIVGSQEECRKLLELVKKQLTKKSHKIIKFKQLADIDRIQFELNAQFNAKFYKPRVIELALRQLSKIDYFLTDCKKFQNKLRNQSIVLLRVQKQYESKCLQEIHIMIDEERRKERKRQADLNDTLRLDSSEHSNLMNSSQSKAFESQIELSQSKKRQLLKKQFEDKQILEKYLYQDSDISQSSMTMTKVNTQLSILSFSDNISNSSTLHSSENSF